MPKRSKKSKSKRLSLKQKYKILKKVKEHHKKKRKELKKSGRAQKAPKDPGIPNQWPFKEELLKELAWQKQKILLDEKNKKEERKRAREQQDVEMGGDGHDLEVLANMRATALNREADFEARKKARLTDSFDADKDKSRKAFYKEFRRVVENADVIIQVLDARDPLACRCTDIERYIRSLNPNKRIILLLNKIDLVPREVAEKWLNYFREELPAVAFKCSTQAQSTNISHKAGGVSTAKGGSLSNAKTADEGLHGSGCLGASTLLQLLKNYTRNQGVKTAITVGVVGLPNVGKSSLINSLIRARVTQVGNTPGVTRTVQEVHLDKNIRLLDSPGVVFSSGSSDAAAVLRNCVRVEALSDPVSPVTEILQRVPAKQLMALYRIPAFNDTDQFLQHIATVRGRLKKGGTPDVQAAAKVVLQDWNNGKIPFFTLPPARTAGVGHESATVVSEWAKEFNAEAVFAEGDKAVLQELQEEEDGRFFQMQSVGGAVVDMVEMMAEDESPLEENGDDMDEGDVEATLLQQGTAGGRGQQSVLYSEAGQFNPHAARAEKKRAKKMKAMQLPEGEQEEEDFDWVEGNADLAAGHEDTMDSDSDEEGDEREEEEDEDSSSGGEEGEEEEESSD